MLTAAWLKQVGKWSGSLALIILLWATLFLYAPAIHFGFIWDDPIWFGHAWGTSWWETLLPNPDFQFYRPLTMLYFWLFMRPDGTFAAELLHWVQIGWHLLNVCLAYALGRRLGLGTWVAVAMAALLALLPLAYQAVAWAAPQQPLAAVLQNGAWLAYLVGRQGSVASSQYSVVSSQYSVTGRWFWFGGSLLLFGLALLVQESSVAVAFVPLLYEFLLRLRVSSRAQLWAVLQRPFTSGWVWALAYPLTAVLFVIVWLVVPRQPGITGVALQLETAVYLTQVLVYPLLGRPWGYDVNAVLPPTALLGLLLLGVVGLLTLAHRHGRGRLALFGLLWAVFGLLPSFAGLDFEYVRLADRLLYAPALGVVLLWSAALWPETSVAAWQRYLATGVWLLIMVQSVWLLLLFSQMYRAGTDHLQAAIYEMGAANGRYLFVNFPDRYLLTRPFYPVGSWGVTLAPVVVDLADFVPLTRPSSTQSTSYSMPWVDTAARAEGPYQIDMRGVIIQANELYQQAQTHDAVYLSRYDTNGRFHLNRAGALHPNPHSDCPLVRFDDIICLHGVQINASADQLALTLDWSATEPIPPHTTIFVHMGQPDEPPLAQADGDSWRGLLPLTSWQPGHLIRDERLLPLTNRPDLLAIRIGIYNWVEGQRWPAVLIEADGRERPLPDDFYQINYDPGE